MRSIRRGDRGEQVADIHGRLGGLNLPVDQAELDGRLFGDSTGAAVRAFQQQRGLLVDGLVGPQTWQELVEAGYVLGHRTVYLRYPYFRGDDVRDLQGRLGVLGFDPGREDGIFGERTAQAVREFQRNVGLSPDGIVGATTLQALGRLRPPGPGPGRTAVREEESVLSPGSLDGRRVAIDPGHGPADPGAVGPSGLTEADAAFALSQELATELGGRRAVPLLLRTPDEDPADEERAARANAANADVVVSVHLNSHADRAAEGASCYYFGRMGAGSVAGQALAERVQEMVTSRLGVKDGRTHPKSFPILRETQMPAVHVEPCFVTNPTEERLLSDERFLHQLAVAIVDGLERFFAGHVSDADG